MVCSLFPSLDVLLEAPGKATATLPHAKQQVVMQTLDGLLAAEAH